MITRLRHILSLFCLCVATLLTGCTSEMQPELPNGEGDGKVTLSLRVSIGNANGAGATRADFLDAANMYELINTLRVIIVREDDNIEYNSLVSVGGNYGVDVMADLDFKVSTSLGSRVYDPEKGAYTRTEKKRIYLIANENSIQPVALRNLLKELRQGRYEKLTDEDLKDMSLSPETEKFVPADKLTPEQAAGWIMYNLWQGPGETLGDLYATPLINNEESNKKFVPMTEFFEINVTENLTDATAQRKQRENLFLTRNLVKFQFNIDATPETVPFRVTKVLFNKLMQKEYLFPNDTEYSPAKYTAAGKVNVLAKEERDIVRYKTPPFTSDNLVAPYMFAPTDFGYNGKMNYMVPTNYKNSYNPFVYFCETKTLDGNENKESLFDVAIEVEFQYGRRNEFGNWVVTPERVAFDPQTLNLPGSLPRNSIVRINMTLGNPGITFEVELVPYIGCFLDPWFGLEEKPNEPTPEEPTPEE